MTSLVMISGAFANENLTDEDLYGDIEDAKLEEDAGLTPDSFFYFIDEFFEDLTYDEENPEEALLNKEEKINEAKEMLRKGNVEAAKRAFAKANKYSDDVEKHITPEIEKKLRRSSKAVKDVFEELEKEIDNNDWEEVREEVEKYKEKEQKIALAAKVSAQIKDLCENLAELDPIEYARVCKTDGDKEAPKWKKDLDRDLTEKQEKEAKEFLGIMMNCFENPRECECEKISIKPFAQRCSVIAPLAAECEEGNEEACEEMEKIEDPFDLLPPHLQKAVEEMQEDFRESEFEHHAPKECREQGVTDWKECEKIMFKLHAPLECKEAFESGKIDTSKPHEAMRQCEEIMFEKHAPKECIDEGIDDPRECQEYMMDYYSEQIEKEREKFFRDDFEMPPECIEAGIEGDNDETMQKCERYLHELYANEDFDGYNHEGEYDYYESYESEECYTDEDGVYICEYESHESYGYDDSYEYEEHYDEEYECTDDYGPVCAEKSDGTMETYSNKCEAYNDDAYVMYEGECEEEEEEVNEEENNNTSINQTN